MPNNLVAIVDWGMGNLFSVRQACEFAGMTAKITSAASEILSADAVLLPGVGAFGDAMNSLKQLNLVSTLKEAADSGKPLMGICLGLQLLMTESREFGKHQGLGLIEGDVVRFDHAEDYDPKSKIPQIGWNQIEKPAGGTWQGSPLEEVEDGDYMYFVHSFYVRPIAQDLILSTTTYGGVQFASSIRKKNIFACQFHPERSADRGLRLYKNLAQNIRNHSL